ncbi:4-diphosphocytidyl-2-C-methyl-D-erythritol kinase [Bartonella bacilliformis str. Heidi Mejia]|uniref:4-(cytidine 5'-diphospho)-2-C-methyl-D-erythritol kinase n=1 Tax=Bartonella bacilliformis TaxID=774 RepID=UPI00044DDBD1|nr:4-(cytidine 5'-diphospho)-2-C-methyl-D-erythritol kinase [Bartonella bacilliformis]EYS92323.1 4-diphosphocytidyl-2-C-methyl-D-erythritol kinase [Bartonella bacilliformis str. Heidi Mejia]KEG16488.1 4-diphosphocytidyl-2-C-methyl-D-erythritol kinase [Bartonella bacilliformis Cond044]KEG18606.1 4-diphosphocytidyl-2-C-methyl-D-erythritol kinase [Bartonella bacilliformis Hosp800-02]KEG23714.1 4-diphosphocytidyl-2-C-methyl-D-erythritol kinase [Bartonella bacilliformis VAB9028]KEG24063.1 4-diphosp
MISTVQDSLEGHFHVLTPIKLNLALHIVGQRTDGYHLLESLVYFSLSGDCLSYAPCERDRFILTGPFAKGLSCNSINLAVRARDFMHKTFPRSAKPSSFQLVKTLPVASGIGGGSGDAASILNILRQKWKLDCSCEELAEMSLALGADVPMCLFALEYQQPLFVKGIGNDVTRLEEACSIAMVLVNHGQKIATETIFNALEKRNHPPLKINPVALKTVSSLVEALQETRNDLFIPALKIAPQLAEVLSTLDESGSLFSRMSGSGATCFGIFKDQQAAQKAAAFIKSMHPNWFVKSIMTLGRSSQ